MNLGRKTKVSVFVLTCIEDENVVDNSFLAVTLSTSKDNQILSELSAAVTISCRGWLTSWHIRVDLNK